MRDDCKYLRSKYNFTPNDFDLFFDFSEIPSNINLEDAVNLSNKLQQAMPLTKILHLHLEVREDEYIQFMSLHTSLSINNEEIRLV